MPTRDVVVVGASAGGVEALRALIAGLPEDFPAALLAVLHMPATAESALPSILKRAGRLPVRHARADDSLERGQVLVAPPGHHLIVYERGATISQGPRENGQRPAIDVLFRSAARTFGPRVTAVLLSGTLDDGTAGMLAVRSRGGVGVVQDPEDAHYAGLPLSAIQGASPEYVLPVADIPGLLESLARTMVAEVLSPPAPRLMLLETAVAVSGAPPPDLGDPGIPSGFTCPECRAVLYEIREGTLVRFRCQVGHAWSAASLAAQQAASMESALWMAVRSLEERANLLLLMTERAANRGHGYTADSFSEERIEVARAASMLRDLIGEMGGDRGTAARRSEQGSGPVRSVAVDEPS